MFDLDTLIREALTSDEHEPRELAKQIAKRIPKENLGEVLVRCLTERVRDVMRWERSEARAERTGGTFSHGKSRLAKASEFYKVDGEYKERATLTADECDILADNYETRAAEQLAIASEFRSLATRIRQAGVTTVGDLEPEPEMAEAA